MLTVLISGFLASTAPALAQDADTQIEPPSGARLRTAFTPAVPDAFEPYLECRMEGVQRRNLDDFEIVSYQALNEKTCDPELRQARDALRAAANGSAGSDADQIYLAATQMLGQLPQPGSVVFQPTSEMFGSAFEVPPGMWDYFVCRNQNTGISVSMQGQPVEPRFPDDEDCSRTREFSREQAREVLTSHGVPTEQHQGLIQGYIEQVDARIRSLETGREMRSQDHD